ncbi:MAG TPA: threonine synthase [Cyanobacteria bacterium UBA8530]|nr:threonine synthase [Cyanobacteria bacterium UBA8530]
MEQIKALRCLKCGKEHQENSVRYTCPACGVEGILEVLYHYDKISINRESLKADRDPSLWRYSPLLPIKERPINPPLQVGWTPLYPVEKMRRELGLKKLFVKDDGRNPTASLKDRASAIGLLKAVEAGAKILTCASTGNAASSWAGAAAASSLDFETIIFLPEAAPIAKIAQLMVFGATVFAVKGTYDDAFDLAIEASNAFGWYNRNTAYNPYLVEGKKTVAYEICEQLNWNAPDKVLVSVGDGCIVSGVYKGFYDLKEMGMIDHIPQLIAVQAEGSASIMNALEGDGVIRSVKAETLADSISVSIPRNGMMAVRDIRNSKGFALSVSDEEILEAIAYTGKHGGVFAEPAGATSIAGLKKLIEQQKLDPDESIVAIVTGNGLKDVASAVKAAGKPFSIEPKLENVRQVLGL